MSNLAFVLVLCAAVSHALWNFYAKKSPANSIALLWAAELLAGSVLLPITIYLFYTQGISATGAGFILVSCFIHATYVWLLGSTYELGDISVVYPIARGTGIVGTVLVATLFGIDNLTLVGFLGAGCIFIGTTVIGFSGSAEFRLNGAFRSALLVGCSIAAYSIVDKMAVAHVSPLQYVCVVELAAAIVLAPWMMKRMKAEVVSVLSTHKLYATLVGLAGIGTYGLVLWAFQLSSASYVVALRETSILVATILGVVLLKEELSFKKILGVLLVVAGAALVKFA